MVSINFKINFFSSAFYVRFSVLDCFICFHSLGKRFVRFNEIKMEKENNDISLCLCALDGLCQFFIDLIFIIFVDLRFLFQVGGKTKVKVSRNKQKGFLFCNKKTDLLQFLSNIMMMNVQVFFGSLSSVHKF